MSDAVSENFAAQKNGAFIHRESHLMGRLGISRDSIRELRQKNLVAGIDWTIAKKHILYSQAGAEKLARSIEASDAPPEEKTRDGGIAAHLTPAPIPVDLLVYRTGFANSQIIEAHLPEKNPADPRNRVRVRVTTDKNFVRGMRIPVLPLGGDLYQLARPCPRSRGQW